MPGDKICLSFDDLYKSYQKTTALQGLSLEVHEGEILGLIGPDSAGKTTAMRIACGLLAPDKGRATLMGFDSTRQTQRAKVFLGYMPQRFSLYPDLTVAENLRFFADLYLVSEKERIQREARLMEFSRLGPFRSRRAGALSGGMKQKLALACTLIHTPKVLILDEPTTGVDPVSRREFWSIIRELAEEGIALLISTPYMDEAMMCHRVLLMHQGQAIAQGAPAEVSGSFSRSLLSLTGTDALKAGRLIRQQTSVKPGDLLRFGDSFHLIYDDPSYPAQLKSLLKHFDVAIEPLTPSIEDAFMYLMKRAERRHD